MLFCCIVYFCVQLNEEYYLVYDRKRNSEEILSVRQSESEILSWCKESTEVDQKESTEVDQK